jgi:hypothetical protein
MCPAYLLVGRGEVTELTLGGCERTETEYRALLTAAGFYLQEVVATASPLSIFVAKPV